MDVFLFSMERMMSRRSGWFSNPLLVFLFVLFVFAMVSSPVCCGQMKFSTVFAQSVPEVTSRQVLVQKHLYIAAVDKEYRQPAWVAYRVCRADWDTDNVLERNFRTPPELRELCLEEGDYDKSGYDIGHMYGLQMVSASRYAFEVNQFCALAAQRPDLNRGPWLKAENAVKALSRDRDVYVVTGLLWIDDMPELPNADESHRVASHCWMLFRDGDGEIERAYLFPQIVAIDAELSSFEMEPVKLKKKVSKTWVSGQD